MPDLNDDNALPADVIDAIRSGHKIEAIKRLREHRGLGLKESKQAVESWIDEQRDELPQTALKSEGSLGKLLFGVAFVVVLYFIVRDFIA